MQLCGTCSNQGNKSTVRKLDIADIVLDKQDPDICNCVTRCEKMFRNSERGNTFENDLKN